MEQVRKRRSRRLMRPCTRRVQRDVPEELIQYIQSLLPVEEAARSSVLSKSWLHAWSTLPTLRFHHQSKLEDTKYIDLINCTLARYFRHNIPILSFDLHFDVHDQTAVSLANKWVRKVASKRCLQELYLTLSVVSESVYMLPDEIFSSENLHTISVTKDFRLLNSDDDTYAPGSLWLGGNKTDVVINCVNLRVLELKGLMISQEVVNKLFSTCTLLEKINLSFCNEFKTIKVKNLRCLHELRISAFLDGMLEISDVPSLGLLYYDSSVRASIMPRENLWLSKDSLGSLRKLFLVGVVIDKAFFDMFKSNFPFLEVLSLDIEHCKLKTLDIACASLQRFDIRLQENIQIDLVVSSRRLLFFKYTGEAIPSLSFPVIVPDQIVLQLKLPDPVHHSFFLKIRETLDLSSNFKIKIESCRSCLTLPFNIDDVRLRAVSFPATNVQQLSFDMEFLLEPSVVLFDALFLICLPKYIKAYTPEMKPALTRYLTKLIAQKDLKDVEEEDLGSLSSWTSLIDGPSNWYSRLFRLTW